MLGISITDFRCATGVDGLHFFSSQEAEAVRQEPDAGAGAGVHDESLRDQAEAVGARAAVAPFGATSQDLVPGTRSVLTSLTLFLNETSRTDE